MCIRDSFRRYVKDCRFMWMLSRSRWENGHRSANVGDTRLEPANVFRSTKRLRGRGKAAYRHVSIKGDMTHLEMEQMRKLVRLTDWKEKGGIRKYGEIQIVINWILTSCQPHRVTTG